MTGRGLTLDPGQKTDNDKNHKTRETQCLQSFCLLVCGAGGNRTLVQRRDCWRFLHVYFCLLSG